MFLKLFKIRPKKFLGIDVGTSSIRIIEIERRGRITKLGNYGEVKTSVVKETPFRSFTKDALLISNKNVAKAIRSICKEAGIQTKEVNFSIPDFCSFFTTFKLPKMSKEELPQAIRYEVRPYVPLPLSEIILDWSIIEGEVSKTPLKILVAAVPNDIVNQYQEIAHLSNLKLKFLEPEAFSLARSLGVDKEGKETISLIDIGARTTACSIVDQGVLKTSHSFNIGGNELTEVIGKSLNIDYNKAEELKKKYGLISEPENLPEGIEDIRKILLPLTDSILEEIKKIFRNFYRDEGREVEKIILSGGLVFLPGLRDYFSAELRKEITIANPFLNISSPPVLIETFKKTGPFYAIAVGLALKGFE